MTQYTNKKTGETINSTLSHQEALEQLLKNDPSVMDTGWLGFWIHKLAQESNPANKMLKGFAAVDAMFKTAIENGRKRPEIRVIFAETMFRLYYPKSGSGNICVKTAVKQETADGRLDFGKAEFIASITASGTIWQPSELKQRGLEYVEQVFFRMLEAAPVKFLAECGKGLGWCSYCGLRLEDNRAIYNGYGHRCSKRWNLEWKKQPTDWEPPTIKQGSLAINRTLHSMIPPMFQRDDWYESLDYLLAADWHEEHNAPETAKKLRNFVITHPYAWTKAETPKEMK